MTVLVLLSLASYRLWRFLARDEILDGPRNVLMRRWRGQGGEKWADGWECSWCLGSLVTFAVVGAYAQVRSLDMPALWALGIASVVGMIGKLDG